MDSIAELSPLPWYAREMKLRVGGCTHEICHGVVNEVVADNVYGEENADFIVHACNIHHELVAALSIATNLINNVKDGYGWSAIAANLESVLAKC